MKVIGIRMLGNAYDLSGINAGKLIIYNFLNLGTGECHLICQFLGRNINISKIL